VLVHFVSLTFKAIIHDSRTLVKRNRKGVKYISPLFWARGPVLSRETRHEGSAFKVSCNPPATASDSSLSCCGRVGC
jgi:hypothetical protein